VAWGEGVGFVAGVGERLPADDVDGRRWDRDRERDEGNVSGRFDVDSSFSDPICADLRHLRAVFSRS